VEGASGSGLGGGKWQEQNQMRASNTLKKREEGRGLGVGVGGSGVGGVGRAHVDLKDSQRKKGGKRRGEDRGGSSGDLKLHLLFGHLLVLATSG